MYINNLKSKNNLKIIVKIPDFFLLIFLLYILAFIKKIYSYNNRFRKLKKKKK